MVVVFLTQTIQISDVEYKNPKPQTVKDLIVFHALEKEVSIPLMEKIIQCESSGNPKAKHISKKEQSYGLVQINRLAHPNISITQAEDPNFAIGYLATELKAGRGSQWTCYKSK